MTTIEGWLTEASDLLLKAEITSARLDAELILSHTLRKPRTYLHAHADDLIDERREDIANARLQMRLDYTPIAYIVGHKWFYGRQFKTTPAALIPRPESETIINILSEIMPKNTSLLPNKMRLVDVGTGTGCLGITAKLEWPELDVTLIDVDTHALNLAKENARNLRADVEFLKANLLHGYAFSADIVVANLPYVDKKWEVSPETKAEPEQALYAIDNGLFLIRKLIVQVTSVVKSGGYLILESDPRQHEAVIAYAQDHGFTHHKTDGFITSFVRA